MTEFKPQGDHRREESLVEWQQRLMRGGASPAYVGAIATGDTSQLGDPSGHDWGQEERSPIVDADILESTEEQ